MRLSKHIVIIVIVLGCGGVSNTSKLDVCTPGQHLPCQCENGDTSVKVCNSVGQAFGICDCGNKKLDCVVSEDCLDSGLVAGECQRVACNLLESQCQVEAIPVGGECDDTNSCTLNDKCTVEGCQGQVMDCNDDSACTVDLCQNGECRNLPTKHDESCTDGDACTVDDLCKSGVCVGSEKLCGDLCIVAECISGDCVNTGINLGSYCDDDDKCTTVDICNSEGECVGQKLQCDDNNICTDDSCESSTGNCSNQAVADGSACINDQDPCTLNSCQAGLCNQPVSDGTVCDDGNACSSLSKCVAGGCQGESDAECDDNNSCTIDSCDSSIGCVYEAVSESLCDDDDPCTLNDECVAGVCSGQSYCEDNCELTLDSCQEQNCSYEWLAQCGNGVLDAGEDCDPGWLDSKTWGNTVWGCAQNSNNESGGYGCNSSCQFQLFDSSTNVSFLVEQSFTGSSGDLFSDGGFVAIWVSESAGELNIPILCKQDLECPVNYQCIESGCQKIAQVRGIVYSSSAQPKKTALVESYSFVPSVGAQGNPVGEPVVAVAPDQSRFAVAFMTQAKNEDSKNGYSLRVYQSNPLNNGVTLINSLERDLGAVEMIHLDLAWSLDSQKLAVLHNRVGQQNPLGFIESQHEVTEYSAELVISTPWNSSYSLTGMLEILNGEKYVPEIVTDQGSLVYRPDGKMVALVHGTYADDIWAFRLSSGAVEQAKLLPAAINIPSNKTTIVSAVLPGLLMLDDSNDILVLWATGQGSKKGIEWRRFNFTFAPVAGGFVWNDENSFSAGFGRVTDSSYFVRWSSASGDYFRMLNIQDNSVSEPLPLSTDLKVANRSSGNGRVLLFNEVNVLVKVPGYLSTLQKQ